MRRFVLWMTLTSVVVLGQDLPVPASALPAARPGMDSLHASRVRLTVRSQAPVGATVTLGDASATADSAGRWYLEVELDSAVHQDSALTLCLQQGEQKACTMLRPRGADTLEIAPLAFRTDSVVTVRDTVVERARESSLDSLLDGRRQGAGSAAVTVTGDGSTKTVVVRGKRRPPKISGQEKVSIRTVKTMPGLAEPDVMRAVQALPGVVQSSDFSTKVYVRGSSSDQNLVLFDNAVVYSPAHLGGIFSTFLADAVGGLDFYKGGFEARYGDRLASVLLVTSKTGGLDPDSAKVKDTWIKGATRLTVASGSLEVEGHQGEFNWVMAGRRTWIDLMLAAARKTGLTDFDRDYAFKDAQGSMAWGRGSDSVRVSVYWGRDALVADPLSIEWGNLVVPVNVRLRLFDHATWLGSLSRSRFDQAVDVTGAFHFDNSITTWNTRQELQYEFGRDHLASLGYEFSNYDALFVQKRNVSGAQTTDSSHTASHALWLQDRWQLGSVVLTAGLRGQDYTGKDEVTFDPRLNASWKIDGDWRLDGSLGRYHQPITSLRMADIEMPTEFWYPIQGPMSIPVATVASGGVERSGLSVLGLRANADLYYKQMENLPLYYSRQSASAQAADSSAPSQLQYSFTKAQGWAMGMELKLAKETGWWTASASYSLAWSAMHQDPYTNSYGTTVFAPYWTDWDQRHTFKLSGDLVWKGSPGNALWTHPVPGRYFRSSFQLNYNSGHPYTGYWNYYAVQPIQGGYPTVYDQPSEHNGLYYPNYFRLDATPIDIGRTGSWRFYWSILNLTNHKNVLTINYDNTKNPPVEKKTYQFPILPVFLGYEKEF